MQKSIEAGVARANITASVGQDNMADYLRLVPAKGVGSEFYAKALVLDDGAERVAIVTADIISFPDKLVHETRQRIEKLTGISGEKILLSASHTHSSPAVNEWDRPAATYLPSRRAESDGWCEHDLSYRIAERPANFSGAIEDVLVEAATKLLSEA